MNNANPTKPEAVPSVRVRRHPVDWESVDLAEITAERAMSLAPRLQRGCWYLNPRFTVSSPAPTAEFFRKVLDLRSSWLRTCRQVLGNHGQRREARNVQRQGRREAFMDIAFNTPGGAQSRQPPEEVPLSTLAHIERHEVIQQGRLAKQAAFIGMLFMNGDLIPPCNWNAMADELLAPQSPS